MEEKLTSRQKQAADTKRRLYLGALELFRQYPYEEVKIKDICDKAEVSVGVFYHYFKNKKDILYEGYVNFDRDLEEFFNSMRDYEPIEGIRYIIKIYLDSTETVGHSYRNVFLRNELEMKYEDYASRKRPFYKEMLKYVKKAIDAGILIGNEIEITDDILRCNKGIVYHWCLYDGKFDLTSEGLKITNIILDYYSKD